MKQEITNKIKAGFSCLYIITHEEKRAEGVITDAVASVTFRPPPDSGMEQRPFLMHDWSITQGILCIEKKEIIPANNPHDMLGWVMESMPHGSAIILRDFHAIFAADRDPVLVRRFRDAVFHCQANSKVIVIMGCALEIPRELIKQVAQIEFKLPTRQELTPVLDGIADCAGVKMNGNRDEILDAGAGLTSVEFSDVCALAVVETGGKDIPPEIVAREKANTIRKNGILEIWDDRVEMDQIGGLKEYKTWVMRRSRVFTKEATEYGLPTPKGCIVIGPPGTGKSLSCKATAGALKRPLLRFDVGRVFASHVGESEGNIRLAIQTAEAIAPCVLWVDELEKAFSGTKSSGSTDGGVTARVFGTFLQWMQEKKSPVFVIATSNDVTALPPELLRKGRWDELWYVGLPNQEERVEIFNIHLKRFGRSPKKFNVKELAQNSDRYTGAEIEAAICDALFSAFDDNGREVITTDILISLAKSVPLAKTMAGEIQALESWAAGRARFATAKQAPATAASETRKLNV